MNAKIGGRALVFLFDTVGRNIYIARKNYVFDLILNDL